MREVQAELLDELPASDARAQRSRRDLRRINAWMGSVRVLERLYRAVTPGSTPRSIVELGGGDGTLALNLARRLPPPVEKVRLTIVDQQSLVSPETAAAFERLGWRVYPVRSDVFRWLSDAEPVDLMLTNLFLHHFETGRLRELLERAAARTQAFVACETRRFSYPEIAGSMVGLIGCSGVTRHDAIISIRAGFLGQELTALWPAGESWRVQEGKAGWLSHGFAAQRV